MTKSTVPEPVNPADATHSNLAPENVTDQKPGPASHDEHGNMPNLRPTGLELVPDQQWTTWRLRNQRPELVAHLPPTFPDINIIRYNEADQALQASIAEAKVAWATGGRFKKRKSSQLRGYRPVHLAFRPMKHFYDEVERLKASRPRRARHHDSHDHDNIPGFWFDRIAFDLFTRVWDFASDTFGQQCFGGLVEYGDWSSRWLQNLPKEFVRYASDVARGDPVSMVPKVTDPNNWEHLILTTESRVFLLVGVMAKILEDSVFDSHLFGATPGQKAVLDRTDRETAFLADCNPHPPPFFFLPSFSSNDKALLTLLSKSICPKLPSFRDCQAIRPSRPHADGIPPRPHHRQFLGGGGQRYYEDSQPPAAPDQHARPTGSARGMAAPDQGTPGPARHRR